MSKKPKHFYSDIYQENFYFIPGWTADQIKKYFGFDVNDKAYGTCWLTNNGIVIWVKHFDIKHLDCLTHETIHAANFIFQCKGIQSDNENDEALAYLVQWIFKNCMRHFRQ